MYLRKDSLLLAKIYTTHRRGHLAIVETRRFLADIRNLLCEWEAGQKTEIRENISSKTFLSVLCMAEATCWLRRENTCLKNSTPVLSTACLETAGLREINGRY